MHTKNTSTRFKLSLHFTKPDITLLHLVIYTLEANSTMNPIPVLYIKPGCPWCSEAQAFFGQHGVQVDVTDVLSNRNALKRMFEISSQSLTPTFEYKDFVVADFSTNEFINALEQRPDIKSELGFGEEDDF